MRVVIEAVDALKAALRALGTPRLQEDLGDGVTAPAIVLGVPALEWEALCGGPHSATIPVWIVMDVDLSRSVPALLAEVERVAEAIDGVEGATVRRAVHVLYPGERPAYEITVEMAL